MNYPTPSAFRRALTGRANEAARSGWKTTGQLLQHFYFAQLLRRVFQHDPDGWILKGGQALLVRYPGARYSRDVDLIYARGAAPDLDEAVAALREAACLDLADHMRFEFRDATGPADECAARTARFNVYIGTTEMAVLSIDVVVDHRPSKAPVSCELPAVLPVKGIVPGPMIRLYPIVDHVADKICAMIERHGDHGAVSSRYRDLVDLIMIICAEQIDGAEQHSVLHAEVLRRQNAGTQIAMPAAFQIPDLDTWANGYAQQAAVVPRFEEFITLGPAAELASRFIDPLLGLEPPTRWHPARREWT